MDPPHRPSATNRALIRSGAAMYAGVGCLGLLESLDGIGGRFSIQPALGALAVALLILVIGPRVPQAALSVVGPLAMIGVAQSLAGARAPTDAAILYSLPVMWVAHFYGRGLTIATVGWLGVVHAIALHGHSNAGSLDRWEDVMGTASMLAIATRFMTERIMKLMNEQHAQARVDPLTGLANRRAFDERFAVDLARIARSGDALSVAVLDIDHFKAVNDRYGHVAGDAVIVRVADALLTEARETDTVARVGGEEFAVALPATDEAGAIAFAERVRERVETDQRQPPVRVSAGVASTTAGTVGPTLLDDADKALYTAKRSGRNRVMSSSAAHAASPLSPS